MLKMDSRIVLMVKIYLYKMKINGKDWLFSMMINKENEFEYLQDNPTYEKKCFKKKEIEKISEWQFKIMKKKLTWGDDKRNFRSNWNGTTTYQ